jgi:urea transport system permease protein
VTRTDTRHRRGVRAALSVAVLLSLCACATRVSAQDEEIRKQVQRLADKNTDNRQDAIENLAKTRDARIARLLQSFQERNLYALKKQVVLCEEIKSAGRKQTAALLDPLSRQPLNDPQGKPLVVDADDLRNLRPTRPEGQLLQNVIRFLQDYTSSDPEKRAASARRLGESRDSAFLETLEKIAETDDDSRVRRTAREGGLIIRVAGDVADQPADQRLAAVTELGKLHSLPAAQYFQQQIDGGTVPAGELSVYQEAIHSVERYQYWISWGRNLTNGLSLGSVLILMALGLSIIYGQMGVINMAHGELMMIGAYATYEMQRAFGHSPDHPSNWYFIAAFPVAFLAAAAVGWLIELIVVRHLYGRPLETLLATWGVSLILIQAARVRYGDNIGVNSPTWLIGGFEVLPDFGIEYARCFILGLCALCVLFVYLLMNFTPIGLKIRATVQGRTTAETLGVATRRVDGFTFALGAGLAGVAGYALTSIAGVTPDMGQNYIVDSFLVVVVGGVGALAGSVWAGLGMGVLDKLVEPTTFGVAILAIGLAIMLTCWIVLTVRAFRESRGWGWLTLLFPVPLPFAIRFWSRPQVGKLFSLYVFGAVAATIGFLRNVMWTDLLGTDVQTRWARVLILLAVVIFIQWRPAGLFPPKGRLADV